MAARRYEISLLVLKNISRVNPRVGVDLCAYFSIFRANPSYIVFAIFGCLAFTKKIRKFRLECKW